MFISSLLLLITHLWTNHLILLAWLSRFKGHRLDRCSRQSEGGRVEVVLHWEVVEIYCLAERRTKQLKWKRTLCCCLYNGRKMCLVRCVMQYQSSNFVQEESINKVKHMEVWQRFWFTNFHNEFRIIYL